MSKCRAAFRKETKQRAGDAREDYRIWQAAWNARGKVDAEICRENNADLDECLWCDCAEAIEKENEQ